MDRKKILLVDLDAVVTDHREARAALVRLAEVLGTNVGALADAQLLAEGIGMNEGEDVERVVAFVAASRPHALRAYSADEIRGVVGMIQFRRAPPRWLPGARAFLRRARSVRHVVLAGELDRRAAELLELDAAADEIVLARERGHHPPDPLFLLASIAVRRAYHEGRLDAVCVLTRRFEQFVLPAQVLGMEAIALTEPMGQQARWIAATPRLGQVSSFREAQQLLRDENPGLMSCAVAAER